MKLQTIITATALATTLAIAAAAPAFAAGTAVVDTQNIISNAPAAKAAVAALNKQRDDTQTKINALEAPLVEKQKKLFEQRNVLAADKFAAAEDSLKKDVLASRTQAQNLMEAYEKQAIATRQKISEAVRLAVAEIAKEKGYDLVLPKAIVPYSGPNVPDITADALTRANAKLGN